MKTLKKPESEACDDVGVEVAASKRAVDFQIQAHLYMLINFLILRSV